MDVATYHRVLPAEMQGPVRWYIHDPQLRKEEAILLHLDQQPVDAIQQTLAEINPYAIGLRQLGQEPAKEIFLQVEWKEESRNRCNHPSRGIRSDRRSTHSGVLEENRTGTNLRQSPPPTV